LFAPFRKSRKSRHDQGSDEFHFGADHDHLFDIPGFLEFIFLNEGATYFPPWF
jgi:hypothetical protein